MTKVLTIFCVLLTGGINQLAVADDFRFTGGSAEEGKVAFERLNCIQCHRVKGIDLVVPKKKRILELSLGKEIRFVERYTDILRAITNPQHVVTKQYSQMLSKAELAGEIQAFMPNMKEDMSVAQLIDLAAFLDKVYRENLAEYEGIKK